MKKLTKYEDKEHEFQIQSTGIKISALLFAM